MPYIPQSERTAYRPRNAGQLAYTVYRASLDFLEGRERYEGMALVIGVLETVKEELYRRVVAPYEDAKIKENGDIARSGEKA